MYHVLVVTLCYINKAATDARMCHALSRNNNKNNRHKDHHVLSGINRHHVLSYYNNEKKTDARMYAVSHTVT